MASWQPVYHACPALDGPPPVFRLQVLSNVLSSVPSNVLTPEGCSCSCPPTDPLSTTRMRVCLIECSTECSIRCLSKSLIEYLPMARRGLVERLVPAQLLARERGRSVAVDVDPNVKKKHHFLFLIRGFPWVLPACENFTSTQGSDRTWLR